MDVGRGRPSMFEEAERVLHARIGALVAEAWGFSPRIVHAIAGHHAPDDALPGARALADTLFLADEIAERVIDSERSETMFAAHPTFMLLGIDEPGVLAGEAKLAFEALEGAFSGDDD
jgi:HD-like signal output (HDOD) protein